MKFVQRTLGESANVSSGQDSARRDYVRIIVIITAGFLAINLFVWATIEIAVRNISVEREAAWFSFFRADNNEDVPELAAFQQALDKLKKHPDTPPYPYTLMMIDSEEPNAFAIAGGVIGITKGLAAALEEDEIAIAFLLGHEIGHFHNRDHLRGAGRALLLGACQSIFFPRGSAEMVSGTALNALLTNYSRKQEEKADLFGLRLVYACYGEAAGAMRLMKLLHEQKEIPEWAYMFTTHPGPEKRIRLLEEALQRMKADS